MIIENISDLENKFIKEIRQQLGAKSPTVKIGLGLEPSTRSPSAENIESMLVNIRLDGYYTQVKMTIDDRYRENIKQQVDITVWPLGECTVKEEVVQLSDAVGFKLTFASPVFCMREFEVKGKDITISLIVENIHRQIEMIQAVEQLQQIIRGIIPTTEKA